MKLDRNCLTLYAVTDRQWLGGKELKDVVKMAIQAGVSFVQLREKDLAYEEFFGEAKRVKEVCDAFKIPLVINDNVELAMAIDADGVHVGQSDMVACDVRKMIGPNKILGVSAQTLEQAILAEEQGADYLGVGAVFSTSTKSDAEEVSLETLKDICDAVSIPVVAIGGINAKNVLQLGNTGIAGVAVISAIFAQKDIGPATKQLREMVERIIV